MSIRVMSHVWEHSAQQEGSLLVLLALADFANDEGVSWPSIATLAQKARLSERQVHNVLNSLVDAHELQINHKAGPRSVNLYRVISGGGANIAPAIREGGAIHDAGVVQSPALGVVKPISPKPSLEPSSEEPSLETAAAAKPSPDGSDLVRTLAKNHENVIGLTTPHIAEQFAMFVREHPFFPIAWVADAFAKAGDNNVRKWSYVRSILESWAVNGRDDQRSARDETATHGPTLDEWRSLPQAARQARGPLIEKLKREGRWDGEG